LEKDLPTLREIVGGTWKKEEELKALKSEVAALERKIQLMLPSADKQKEQTSIDKVTALNNESQNITYTKKDAEKLMREQVIVVHSTPSEIRVSKPLKL